MANMNNRMSDGPNPKGKSSLEFSSIYVKFENPEDAFTHTLNELRSYINCGIVVLISPVIVRTGGVLALSLVLIHFIF